MQASTTTFLLATKKFASHNQVITLNGENYQLTKLMKTKNIQLVVFDQPLRKLNSTFSVVCFAFLPRTETILQISAWVENYDMIITRLEPFPYINP